MQQRWLWKQVALIKVKSIKAWRETCACYLIKTIWRQKGLPWEREGRVPRLTEGSRNTTPSEVRQRPLYGWCSPFKLISSHKLSNWRKKKTCFSQGQFSVTVSETALILNHACRKGSFTCNQTFMIQSHIQRKQGWVSEGKKAYTCKYTCNL